MENLTMIEETILMNLEHMSEKRLREFSKEINNILEKRARQKEEKLKELQERFDDLLYEFWIAFPDGKILNSDGDNLSSEGIYFEM